jgi:AcrR family transcriptional regulator
MSPRVADPEVRQALVDTAARVLSREGPGALTTRRLADEIGTSTTVVYTHFGGMDGLRRAVREEGFARLTGYFNSVRRTRDPVADLSALGWAYCFNGVANPNLYRAVFLEPPADPDEEAIGRPAIELAIDTVERCIEAGRFAPADPEALAVQLWAGSNGMVAAVLAHLLTVPEITQHFAAMGFALFVGFGDEPKRAKRSLRRARDQMEPLAPDPRPDRASSRPSSSTSPRSRVR